MAEGADPDRYKVGEATFAGADVPKLTMAVDEQSGSDSCATFVLSNEDHSLGNSLRWMLSKDPRVEFCGYAVPHPSEKKINLRVQAREGVSAKLALRDALANLRDMCNHMTERFIDTATQFREANDLAIPRYFLADTAETISDSASLAAEQAEEEEEAGAEQGE